MCYVIILVGFIHPNAATSHEEVSIPPPMCYVIILVGFIHPNAATSHEEVSIPSQGPCNE
jgi:hypothetical protein